VYYLSFWAFSFGITYSLSFDELLGIWKEEVVIYFKVLSQGSPGERKESKKTKE
jgi:hypothetical protein